MYVVYALLCGLSVYIALLAAFGRRMPCNRWATATGSLALAVSFCILALGTAGVLQHGRLILVSRAGFAIYTLSLLVIIGQYWWAAWRAR